MANDDVTQPGTPAQSGRTYLNVPYVEREAAKALGAKFDRASKKWYAPAGTDTEPFARWMGEPPTVPDGQPVPINMETMEERIEKEAVRTAELTGVTIDDARELVMDRLERETLNAAREAFFASWQSTAGASVKPVARPQPESVASAPAAAPNPSPTDPARSSSDEHLGREFRAAVMSIVTSVTLKGGEVNATLALENRLDAILNSPDGNRTIGEQIRTRTGFAAEPLPPQAAAALAKLRAAAGFEDPILAPEPSEPSVALTEARAREEKQNEEDVEVLNEIAHDLDRTPEKQPEIGSESAAGAIDGTRAAFARPLADVRPVASAAIPASNEPLNSAANEPDLSKPVATANVERTARPAANEGDARNPANDHVVGRVAVDGISPVDEARVKAARERDSVDARQSLGEAAAVRESAMRSPEPPKQQQGAPSGAPADIQREADTRPDATVNTIELESSQRKPVLSRDGYEIPAAIAARYMAKEGAYWRLDSKNAVREPHFEDKGPKLASPRNDRETIADMVAVAQAKNWDSITVKGSEQFRRNAWIEASLAGVEVNGFKPTEADHAQLEAVRRERDALTIGRGQPPAPSVSTPATASPKQEAASVQSPLQSGVSQANQRSPVVAPEKEKPFDPLSGELLEYGAAPYQHKADGSPSYFVRYRDGANTERTVWGVDLQRAMSESDAKAGDSISLKNLGKQAVTIQETVRDEAGVVIGSQPKDTVRNAWEVKRVAPEREPEREQSAPTQQSSSGPAEVAQPTAQPEKLELSVVARMREQLEKSLAGSVPARTRAELLNRFDARMQVALEVQAQVDRGEVKPEAAAAAIDSRVEKLHAQWTAPKAAPTTEKPERQPDVQQQPSAIKMM
ncbi:LPD7 domain-containing protein [Burkholderia diffusa]|uniref:LPD7 domain-containing protein n=1 Tax=Burkholderia diffusa TaxID=488732 RepID=UPI001CB22953|nr:LPD7 domain-containing protein [Burkholderia diffusa]CAG9264329.1 LPD7 domain-containing protein [Burkholderia diffusa]